MPKFLAFSLVLIIGLIGSQQLPILGPVIIVAMISLALNLVMTGVFISIIRKLQPAHGHEKG